MNHTVLTRRARRLLPLAAVVLGVGAMNLVTAGSAAAFSNCNSGFASVNGGPTSPPCETFGRGSANLLDIRLGDFSQLMVTADDPDADLLLRVNLDPPINCIYQGRAFQGLTGDQYNVIVNGGSPVNQPTLHETLSSAVAGGLRGAQLTIDRGQAQVCFGSKKPFIPKPGSPLLRTSDPTDGVLYVGLLPDCRPASQHRPAGPCVTGRTATYLPTPNGGHTGVVNVFFTVPPGWDHRCHG